MYAMADSVTRPWGIKCMSVFLGAFVWCDARCRDAVSRWRNMKRRVDESATCLFYFFPSDCQVMEVLSCFLLGSMSGVERALNYPTQRQVLVRGWNVSQVERLKSTVNYIFALYIIWNVFENTFLTFIPTKNKMLHLIKL